MPEGMQVHELLAQARRNEEIQRRLEVVEQFLLAHHDLPGLLTQLPSRLSEVYDLQAASLVLLSDNPRLAWAWPGFPAGELPSEALARPRSELRLWLVDLERPFLSHQPHRDLLACLFARPQGLASLAAIPLWVRAEMLGVLALGSASPGRFHPSLETHFLASLGRKAAQALDAAMLREEDKALQKRQAAMEMAGAACHEMAQPLTTLTLQLEMLLRQTPEEDPRRKTLLAMEEQAVRLGELVQRISRVNEYVTKPYAQGMRIIDLQAASQGPRPPATQEGEG